MYLILKKTFKALKWGILHFCILYGSRDMGGNVKYFFFQKCKMCHVFSGSRPTYFSLGELNLWLLNLLKYNLFILTKILSALQICPYFYCTPRFDTSRADLLIGGKFRIKYIFKFPTSQKICFEGVNSCFTYL